MASRHAEFFDRLPIDAQSPRSFPQKSQAARNRECRSERNFHPVPCCMAKLSDGYREDHLLFDDDLKVRLRLAPAFFGRPDVHDVTRRCRIDYPPRDEAPFLV